MADGDRRNQLGISEIITWAILIWGFTRIQKPPEAGSCQFANVTENDNPSWVQELANNG